MSDLPKLSALIPPELAGLRLDQALARVFGDYSRTNLKNWLIAEHILVNGAVGKPRDQVLGGEEISILEIPQPDGPDLPEKIELDVVYSDDDLLVVNKPPGLVTHPGAGNRVGTMMNGLLHLFPELSDLPRAGIVHRLDKDTSGLMVVARSLPAHTHLAQALQEHRVQRTYHALCCNVPISGGTISAPIGRHPTHRTKMAVVTRGKSATTHYRVINRFAKHAHLEVTLETGRTHQIRVHMAHTGFPLIGDPNYGSNKQFARGISDSLRTVLANFPRQALHAARLALEHPIRSELMQWEALPPDDFSSLLTALTQNELGSTG